MTQLTPKYRVKFWRGRVRYWQFVVVPICTGLIIIVGGAGVWLGATKGWLLALVALIPLAIAGLSLRIAIEGWRFAAGVLEDHEAKLSAHEARQKTTPTD